MELYPEINNVQSTMLDVGGGHQIYVEECGTADGIPVVFLHGGPGSGCNENHRRYFNPEKYRIIIFDQRGCNRSKPQGSVENNTTQDLIQDMETIRNHFNIEKWLVFGGSWGATLGLLYAQTHPERVLAMVLRGAFLARQKDLDWFIKDGANNIFPDHWDDFIQQIPEPERRDIVSAVHQRIFGDDQEIKHKFAKAWSDWAGKVVTYNLTEVEQQEDDSKTTLCEVSIETHYAKNMYFINEDQILNNNEKLPDVPTIIIHGRRDLTCTLDSSWDLHKAIPNSELVIVPTAGHLAGEPTMTDALITATNKMAEVLT